MPDEMMPHKMMRANHAKALHDKIAKKAPIEGVWIGNPDDKSTWGVHFKNATEQQIADANAEIQAYDTFPTIIEGEVKRASDLIGAFIEERYSLRHQMALSNLRMDAKIKKKVSAETYLDSCWDWMSNVMNVYYTKEAQILTIVAQVGVTKTKQQAATEVEQLVDAIDLSAHDATDPKVTIKEAMRRLNEEA
jgi:predicted small secreted protein